MTEPEDNKRPNYREVTYRLAVMVAMDASRSLVGLRQAGDLTGRPVRRDINKAFSNSVQ